MRGEMTMRKILVVEDEADAVELITYILRTAGFDVIPATNGQEGLNQARACSPSVIVLDVMLPEIDGFEVCRLLRGDPLTADVPIIFLTALSSELSRVVGLESGADDYLIKPFSPRELVSRVSKLARQAGRKQPRVQFHLRDLFIDLSKQLVTVNGFRVELTKRE